MMKEARRCDRGWRSNRKATKRSQKMSKIEGEEEKEGGRKIPKEYCSINLI
jgi:hypothetical protein